jgi:hypothetical protein
MMVCGRSNEDANKFDNAQRADLTGKSGFDGFSLGQLQKRDSTETVHF